MKRISRSYPFSCLVVPPPQRLHTAVGSICSQISKRHTHETPYPSLSLSLSSLLSMGAHLLPTSFTAHRAKAAPVKLLKWHYSSQFFSLYLKCLNVWQINQSSYPPCTTCAVGEKEVKGTKLHPLPTQQLEERRDMRKQQKVWECSSSKKFAQAN